jgi:hypothetical protein
MKKAITLLLTISASATTFATLKYDPMTDRISSENAPKNVDQNEYNNILQVFLANIGPRTIYQLSNYELATFFSYLQSVGTPTALQLIRDIEELIKEHRKNIQRLQNL